MLVADLCPYWTSPPTGGGPLRVHHLNCRVAQHIPVAQLSVRPTFGHRHGGRKEWIGSRIHKVAEQYLEYQYFHPLVLGSGYLLYRLGLHSDLFLSETLRLLAPRYMYQVVRNASVIQVEHPWLFRLALQLANGRPIIYVAHNVEATLWDVPAQGRRVRFPKLAMRTRELEREAAQRANMLVAMSAADAEILVQEYAASMERIVVIPNGVDVQSRRPATPEEKARARARLELDSRPVLLFTGSDHYPNKEALRHIQRWQEELGAELGVQFIVVGNVGQGVRSTEYMKVVGFVKDPADYLLAADIALNPLTSGSGTSLKAVEYLACGLPTVTTAVGMRGLTLTPERDVLVGAIAEFPHLITRLVADQGLQRTLAGNGRQVAVERYSWEHLGSRMLNVYERALQCASV